ncbi:MAG: RNA polymerase sigma factor [Frankiales bacterium]|nr:RNA polymerase sigma factor [Frankiales bacterium]
MDDDLTGAGLTREDLVDVELADLALPPSVAERVLHSDPHDFAGLYIRHRSSFTLHARRYLRDQRDADEVVQEAFLRLFLALPELETELQALAYCRRTITNLCIDRFRAQARRPYLVDLDSVPLDVLVDDDPGDPVVRAEDAALVRAALSLLSPLHRAALVKREIEEKPLPVIAAELEIPEDSVKHVLFRARKALRRILAESSLAPGGGGQLSEALAKAMSKSGLAVIAGLMVLVGLGSGPDLRTIPVVGPDLPNLPSIGEIMSSIGQAITGNPVTATAPSGSGGGVTPVLPEEPPLGGSQPLVVAASASPSATATAMAMTPATPTVGLQPNLGPKPGAASPSPEPTAHPTAPPAPAPSPPAASPSAIPSPAESPKAGPPAPSQSPSSGPSPSHSSTASPTPTSPRPARKSRRDPSAWITPGPNWVPDPDTLILVQVPVGESAPYSDSYWH